MRKFFTVVIHMETTTVDLSSTYAHLIDNEPEFISKVDNSVNLKLHRVHKSKGILVLI